MSPITPSSRNFYGVKSVQCPAFTLVVVRIYPKLPANSRTQKITNLFCWDNRKPLKNGWWEPGWSSLSLKCLKTFLGKSAYIKSKGLYKMSRFTPLDTLDILKEIWCSVLYWHLPKVRKSAQKFWFDHFSKREPVELTQNFWKSALNSWSK